jgi:hypothetical protein
MSDVLIHKTIHDRSGERIEAAKEVDVDGLKDAAENIPGEVVQGAKSGEALKSRCLPGNWKGLPLICGY